MVTIRYETLCARFVTFHYSTLGIWRIRIYTWILGTSIYGWVDRLRKVFESVAINVGPIYFRVGFLSNSRSFLAVLSCSLIDISHHFLDLQLLLFPYCVLTLASVAVNFLRGDLWRLLPGRVFS